MIRFLLVRTCEAVLLTAVIVATLYAAATIAPVFGVGCGGGFGTNNGVVQFEFRIKKTPLASEPKKLLRNI